MWFTLLLVFVAVASAAQENKGQMEAKLVNHLLRSYRKDHSTYVRPLSNSSATMQLSFGLQLIKILDLDFERGNLRVSVWHKYMWRDNFLSWNPRRYGGISSIRIPIHKIWKPDMELYNGLKKDTFVDPETWAVVSSSGDVLWIAMAEHVAMCDLDPSERVQKCSMKFGSWTYDGFKLDVNFFGDKADFDVEDYVERRDWAVSAHSAKKETKYYPCCPEPYPSLTFDLQLRRND